MWATVSASSSGWRTIRAEPHAAQRARSSSSIATRQSRQRPGTAVASLRRAKRDAALGELALEPRQQRVELLVVVGVERLARGADMRRGDHAAPAQDLLAQREPDAGLLLVAHHRQIEIVEILGALAIAGEPAPADLDQHLGIGEAGVGAVGAARQLLRQIERGVADQD